MHINKVTEAAKLNGLVGQKSWAWSQLGLRVPVYAFVIASSPFRFIFFLLLRFYSNHGFLREPELRAGCAWAWRVGP